MKYEGQRETYRFIGDSTTNQAKRMVKGEPIQTFTQTSIIEAFNDNKNFICGGSKLLTGKNDSRVGYMVYFGNDKTNPEQIINIVLDKDVLESGDVNALAIDSLCQYAIRVNNKNNKKLALAAIAGTLGGLVVAGSLIGGLIWADSKEQNLQEEKANEYQGWLHQERMENGTYKSWLEEQNLIDMDSVNEVLEENVNRRSF